MPIIPLKQIATITRITERDEWGEPISGGETFELRCRIDDGSRLAQSNFTIEGQSVVSSGEVIEVTSLLFNKYADIRYSDTITYVDGGEREITAKPIKIVTIRGVNGKPILTEVIL